MSCVRERYFPPNLYSCADKIERWIQTIIFMYERDKERVTTVVGRDFKNMVVNVRRLGSRISSVKTNNRKRVHNISI